MPYIQKDFDSYKMWYYSGHPYEALIYLYSAKTYVARLVFFKNDVVLAANAAVPEPSINYHIGKFSDVVTILREEKPLYVGLNTDNGVALLSTGDFEPTGEEEGA